MNLEEIKKRLRTPQKVVKEQAHQAAVAESRRQAAQRPKTWLDYLPVIALGVTVGVLLLSLVFVLASKNKAENIPSALDPENLKGLSVEQDFNPSTGVRYVQVREGRDRSATVAGLGTTIPILSRFNLNTLNQGNFETIGAAPWALTLNISSNIDDPDILPYLLNRDDMIKAFINRPDAANLLNDPIELKLFVEDKAAMDEFFQDETVRRVLQDEKLLNTFAGSRFMAFLLISKSGKYYRDHPQEAAQIINSNHYLVEMKQNPLVRAAVEKNTYLKKIAPILLK